MELLLQNITDSLLSKNRHYFGLISIAERLSRLNVTKNRSGDKCPFMGIAKGILDIQHQQQTHNN